MRRFGQPVRDRGGEAIAPLRPNTVFGVRIDCDTNAEAERFIRSGGGKMCAFVNAHCLNVSLEDGGYRDILNRFCDKVWPDGHGVRMAARSLGFTVPENVNGTDLFPQVAAAGGLSFWFLGGRPGVAERALRNAAVAFPASRFLGAADGYRKDWTPVLEAIAKAKPDVLLVGMGVPIQEKWMAAHERELRAAGVGCTLGVGGLFDFVSGRIPRAPVWLRHRELEWVWRLAMEPRRMFRRYIIGNFAFLRQVRKERAMRQASESRG